MKLMATVRRVCLAVLLSASAWSVHATIPPNVFEVTEGFGAAGGFQFKYYPSFLISTPSTYKVMLTDAGVLAPFLDLGVAVFLTGGDPVAPPLTHTGSFTFDVASPSSYTVLAFGTPGDKLSTYGITITPIPEPEVWALMLVGTGLVGFQLRRKRRAAEANRLSVA